MRDKNYPGVSKYKDRHGHWRWRARSKGRPQRHLPGQYGSPEFIQAWEDWSSQKAPGAKSRVTQGTISALISAYYGFPEFNDELADTTKKAYRATLERFRAKNADKSTASLTKENITAIRDRLRPEPSNMMLRVLRHLCKAAAARGLLKEDPTLSLRKVRTKTDGIHAWTEAEMSQYVEFHKIGTKPYLAFALLLYTAQRRSDVVVMGKQHEVNGGKSIRIRQRKTGEWLTLPIVPALRKALDAGPTGSLTYLESEWGKGFTVASFGNWFGLQCRRAGLEGCTAHGLRKAAAVRMAMAGATAHEIQSVTGHKTLSEVQRYTKSVTQSILADGMSDALSGTNKARESGDPLPSVGEPVTKSLK